MAVLSGEIHFYRSGTGSLGGAIDTSAEIPTGVLHTLFDAITATETVNGDTEYRCIFIKNTNVSDTLTDAIAYISVDPSASGTSIELGVSTKAIDVAEEIITNEDTAPSGDVTFTALTGPSNPVSLATLPAGSYKGLWIKRVVAAGSSPLANDTFSITALGETA